MLELISTNPVIAILTFITVMIVMFFASGVRF